MNFTFRPCPVTDREINLETIERLLEKILLVNFEWRFLWPLFLLKEVFSSRLNGIANELKMAALSSQDIYSICSPHVEGKRSGLSQNEHQKKFRSFTNPLNASAEDSNMLEHSTCHEPLPGQWKCSLSSWFWLSKRNTTRTKGKFGGRSFWKSTRFDSKA